MIAHYLDILSPFIWEIRPGFGLRWYGLAYVMAFVAGYLLYRRLAERGYSQLAPDKVDGFITGVAFLGVMLGGRIGHFIFYTPGEFAQNPLSFFKVWEGGMSSHGGMLGIIFFTFYYARRHKLSWPGLGDNLVVVAPIGLFFGRIANFINGELFGRILVENPKTQTLPWGVQFPRELIESPPPAPALQEIHARLVEQAVEACEKINPMLGHPVAIFDAARTDPRIQDVLRDILPVRHPSQIYEALLEGVALFAVLYFLRTKTRQPRGVLTGLFFILYALARIFCECFREPEDALIGIFTRGQFLSLFLIAIGAAFVIYGRRTRQYERVPAEK